MKNYNNKLPSNRDFRLQSFELLLGKSFWFQERLKTQFGEESSSSGLFSPVGCLQQETTHRAAVGIIRKDFPNSNTFHCNVGT